MSLFVKSLTEKKKRRSKSVVESLRQLDELLKRKKHSTTTLMAKDKMLAKLRDQLLLRLKEQILRKEKEEIGEIEDEAYLKDGYIDEIVRKTS